MFINIRAQGRGRREGKGKKGRERGERKEGRGEKEGVGVNLLNTLPRDI
jgi:hypothetical protein